MGLSARLQLRQSQSLVMTPQLMQSIRLLQLTHVELDRFIDEEVERNPLLERVEATPSEPEVAQADWSAEDAEWSAGTMASRLDTSLENVFPDDPGMRERVAPDLAMQWKSLPAGSPAGDGFDMDDLAGAAVSLRAHVDQQVALAFADPVDRYIARQLADMLDETGYLDGDPAELAGQLGVRPPQVEDVLRTCQGFEPVGIFARGLAECLSLQLAARDRLDPAMRALLDRLDLLARRDFASLRRICGVDEEDLLDMLAEIRNLDPKPGLAFAGGVADPVVPEVIVRAASDGSWAVELNPDTLPRVLVHQTYYAEVSRHAMAPEERQFMADCLQSANWLTRSLDQRARTIMKVASEIVRQQDAFLLHGIRHLRPLNLRMVADAIGMHESTVSRVTANKFMMTPRGVFELRFFFTASIAAADGGDAHSAESVRDQIRELIAGEQPEDILSDDAIVDILKKEGVDIARRTVAKYREGMNIPSSVQRRREKRALAEAGR